MQIYIERDNQTKEINLKKPKMIKDILVEENIVLESVILVKNDKICLEDEFVTDSDSLKILSVVSGG